MRGVLNYLCIYLSQSVAITSKVLSLVVGSMFWMEKNITRYIFYLTNILRILFHSYYNLAPHQRNSSTAWGWGGLRCSATRYRWWDREKGRSVRQGHVGVLFILEDGRRALPLLDVHHIISPLLGRSDCQTKSFSFLFSFLQHPVSVWLCSSEQRLEIRLESYHSMSGMIFVWDMVKASCQIQMCWTCFGGYSWITDFFTCHNF